MTAIRRTIDMCRRIANLFRNVGLPADMPRKPFAVLMWGHRRSGVMGHGLMCFEGTQRWFRVTMHWKLYGVSWRGRFIGVMQRVASHGGEE